MPFSHQPTSAGKQSVRPHGTASGGERGFERPQGFRPQSSTWRSRSALEMTETELRVIAALAIIGLKSQPKAG